MTIYGNEVLAAGERKLKFQPRRGC